MEKIRDISIVLFWLWLATCNCVTYLSSLLKYGFCKKYFDRNEPLTSWTLLSPVFFQISTDERFIFTEVTFYKIHILKYGFSKKLLLYEWISEQLNIFHQNQIHTMSPILFWWKKCLTAQRFIRKEITSYKIHTLVQCPFLGTDSIRGALKTIMMSKVI